jgi:DNA-binding transcriptional MerR regulator
MFKIGDFSRIARVSCRLLRYYDELGLLKPAIVDRDSGYRFYGAAQLPQLNRILVLKELGLTLDQIGRATSSAVSADELRAMLLIRRVGAIAIDRNANLADRDHRAAIS